MRSLHFRPCDAHTPVVIHDWVYAGFGNALGQLLLSLHFAAQHGRTLVVMLPIAPAKQVGHTKESSEGFIRADALESLAASGMDEEAVT